MATQQQGKTRAPSNKVEDEKRERNSTILNLCILAMAVLGFVFMMGADKAAVDFISAVVVVAHNGFTSLWDGGVWTVDVVSARMGTSLVSLYLGISLMAWFTNKNNR